MAGRPKSREGKYERISLEVRENLLSWLDEQQESRREIIEEALFDLKAKKEGDKMKMATIAVLNAALEKFLVSDDFKSGVISSTKASWAGSGYSVELLPDGTWQVLWNNQIGNLYETSGVIFHLPALDIDGMAEYVDGGAGSEDDFLSEAFYVVEDELKAEMRSMEDF